MALLGSPFALGRRINEIMRHLMFISSPSCWNNESTALIGMRKGTSAIARKMLCYLYMVVRVDSVMMMVMVRV